MLYANQKRAQKQGTISREIPETISSAHEHCQIIKSDYGKFKIFEGVLNSSRVVSYVKDDLKFQQILAHCGFLH